MNPSEDRKCKREKIRIRVNKNQSFMKTAGQSWNFCIFWQLVLTLLCKRLNFCHSSKVSLIFMSSNFTYTKLVHLKNQAFSQAIYPATRAGYVHEQNIRREISKGTGVFIPLSSHPRRKNRQPRHFSSNTKIQGQTERQLNQVPPHYNSLNPTRLS